MEKETFIQDLRQQFINPEAIDLTFDSEFRNAEDYDSLTGMTIMVMLQDKYKVVLSLEEYKAQKTVGELYNIVLKKAK